MAKAPTEAEAKKARKAHERAENDANGEGVEAEEEYSYLDLTLTMPDTGERVTNRLDLLDLTPGDDKLARSVTGSPTATFLGSDAMGMDGVLFLFWLAGRKGGERTSYRAFMALFPNVKVFAAADPDVEMEFSDPLG